MPKATHRSEPYSFRLPLRHAAKLEELAAAKGISPGKYLEDAMTKALEKQLEPEPSSNARTLTGVAPPAAKAASIRARREAGEEIPTTVGCAHKDKTIIGGGMARCTKCGATRRADGEWV